MKSFTIPKTSTPFATRLRDGIRLSPGFGELSGFLLKIWDLNHIEFFKTTGFAFISYPSLDAGRIWIRAKIVRKTVDIDHGVTAMGERLTETRETGDTELEVSWPYIFCNGCGEPKADTRVVTNLEWRCGDCVPFNPYTPKTATSIFQDIEAAAKKLNAQKDAYFGDDVLDDDENAKSALEKAGLLVEISGKE